MTSKELDHDTKKMEDAAEKEKMTTLTAIYFEWVVHEDWNSKWPSVEPKSLTDFVKEYYPHDFTEEDFQKLHDIALVESQRIGSWRLFPP